MRVLAQGDLVYDITDHLPASVLCLEFSFE
jgi:hypothetical protein